ncbi:hypothetical protein [Streptomyces sp. NPDC021356]|uniref:hypothetical protein n=1 Tax=Streptomyces sp. NPDC021356 TaxID=3154900 RepID=UPI0033CDE970
MDGDGKPSNVEAITCLPDTFFAYNRNDTAWKWMQYVYDRRDDEHPVAEQGTNGDYPEVSYTLVSQTVEGLMGVQPDAPDHALATAARLPSGMSWLQVKDLRVGRNTFTLRHDGTTKSTLTNAAGPDTCTWEARFAGSHRSIKVNGLSHRARTKQVNGTTYSYVTVPVAPGASVTAEAA